MLIYNFFEVYHDWDNSFFYVDLDIHLNLKLKFFVISQVTHIFLVFFGHNN